MKFILNLDRALFFYIKSYLCTPVRTGISSGGAFFNYIPKIILYNNLCI